MMTRGQALDLLRSDDLVGIGMAARAVREQLHPERIVSYRLNTSADTETAATTVILPPDETPEQFVSRLERLRDAQTGSGSAAAVSPRCSGTAVEYLRVLAVARLFLDNIPHVQTSWDVLNAHNAHQTGGTLVDLKLCQIALSFGADDISGPENERRRPTEEQLRRLIRDAGFIPKQRDALFRTYFVD